MCAAVRVLINATSSSAPMIPKICPYCVQNFCAPFTVKILPLPVKFWAKSPVQERWIKMLSKSFSLTHTNARNAAAVLCSAPMVSIRLKLPPLFVNLCMNSVSALTGLWNLLPTVTAQATTLVFSPMRSKKLWSFYAMILKP